MDKYNLGINAIIAMILSVSPHFFDGFNVKAEDIRKTYMEAQKRADYIIASGDASELAGLDGAVSELALYQSQLDVLTPTLLKLQQQLVAKGVIPPLSLPPQ